MGLSCSLQRYSIWGENYYLPFIWSKNGLSHWLYNSLLLTAVWWFRDQLDWFIMELISSLITWSQSGSSDHSLNHYTRCTRMEWPAWEQQEPLPLMTSLIFQPLQLYFSSFCTCCGGQSFSSWVKNGLLWNHSISFSSHSPQLVLEIMCHRYNYIAI